MARCSMVAAMTGFAAWLFCLVPVLADDGWTGFRGSRGDSVAEGAELPLHWSEERGIAWKVELPGGGWSQPVVQGGRVYVTCAAPIGEDRTTPINAGLAGVFNAANRGEQSSGDYRFQVLAFDSGSGELVWERVVHEGIPRLPKHRANSFASETPASDGKRVVASFGANGMWCLSTDGEVLWDKQLGAFPMQMGWGTGSSPVIFEERVFVLSDNDQESFLSAIDLDSGDELWRVAREEKSNWSTPYVWRNASRTELVVAGGTAMRSYDPQTGDLLWEMKGSGRAAMSPVGSRERVFLDSADRMTGGRGMLAAVASGGAGDLTLPPGERSSPQVPWSVPLNSYRVASPLLYHDCLYLLEQGSGVIRCFDAASGKLHYQQRLPQSGGSYASPWGAADRVYCLDLNGQTVVLRSGPAFEVLTTNRLQDGQFGASAAIDNNRLLLRGSRHLYCMAP
ncbi:MAG: PQQ-binding-like beta-propeller repeat protein [Planctomycetales bacterium]